MNIIVGVLVGIKMITPSLFTPTPDFWQAVNQRLPANQGHAQNIFLHGPFVGTVGEVAFEYWFKQRFPGRGIRYFGDTWYDYMIDTKTAANNRSVNPPPSDERNIITIEVKTKLRTSFPLKSKMMRQWEVSIPDYLLEHFKRAQKPDIIFAISVQSKLPTPTKPEEIDSIAILGWIPYSTFMNWKQWVPKGTRMGGGRPSPKDMWNIYLRYLNDGINL